MGAGFSGPQTQGGLKLKWFKHISDSLDDPKIFELIRRHKAEGYLVFFGVLEIYAREFKTDPGWILRTSPHYVKTKLQIYHANRLTIIVRSIEDLFSWSVNLTEDSMEVYIPKFRKYLDETTLKKLRYAERNSGSVPECVPEKFRIEVDVEEEVDNRSGFTGNHYSQRVGKLKIQIDSACQKIESLPEKQKARFNPFAWVQYWANRSAHPQAIHDVLVAVIKNWHKIKSPWPYADKSVKVRSQNYTERDHVKIAQQFKKQWELDPKVQEMVGNLFEGVA